MFRVFILSVDLQKENKNESNLFDSIFEKSLFMDNYSLKDIFNIYESKVPKRENGNPKHIHKDFEERKCHCECVALRGDSQNQSESHRLWEWTLWLNICNRNHRTTEKRKSQWFLWKFGGSVGINRKLQTHQSGFGKRDFDTFWDHWNEKQIPLCIIELKKEENLIEQND